MAHGMWSDIEGRMCRDGVDVDTVLADPAYVLIGLLLSYVIDDQVSWDRPRQLARGIVLWCLRYGRMPTDAEVEAGLGMDRDEQIGPPDPETWGLDPDSVAAQDRALAMLGGG